MRKLLMTGALALLASSPLAAAEERPLWEFGLGAGALSFPAYRGSDQRENFMLPVPRFYYHGKVLRADRRGVRGVFFDSDRLELTLSAALSPPVRSEDIQAREGMSDLKASFEIGPQVDLTLWRSDSEKRALKLLVPLRAAFTLESQPQHIGWVFHPKLNLDLADLPGLPGWNLGLLAGPLYGDRRQHAYYYSVKPGEALPDRPTYDAPSGYAGMQMLASLSKRYPGYWVGAFARYDNLSGSSFAASPLLRDKHYVAGGLAVTWILGESSTRVRVDD